MYFFSLPRIVAPVVAIFLSVVPSQSKEKPALPVPERFGITKKIHALIVKKSKDDKALKGYSETVPKAQGGKIEMIPVKGGELMLGSPEKEKGRQADEGSPEKGEGPFVLDVQVRDHLEILQPLLPKW